MKVIFGQFLSRGKFVFIVGFRYLSYCFSFLFFFITIVILEQLTNWLLEIRIFVLIYQF